MYRRYFNFIAIVGVLAVVSCGGVRDEVSGSTSNNSYIAPTTSVSSYNSYDLEVSEESVSYTIDISTPEGKTKLRNLSLREAEQLALTEAVVVNKCAMIINPQYTHLKKGDRVLRVTVYGFPAKYKNQK